MTNVNYHLLRYIVPFSFSDVFPLGNQFASAIHKAVSSGEWIPSEIEDEQCDLYDYIKNTLMIHNPNYAEKNNVCYAFDRKMDPLKVSMRAYDGFMADFRIVSAGLYVFRSETGFFWYEISVDQINDSRGITSNDLIQFQFIVKEINNMTYESALTADKGYNLTSAGKAFQLSEWVDDILQGVFDHVHYFSSASIGERTVPERALIFCDAVLDCEEEELIKTGFYLARGSQVGSVLPYEVKQDMFIPFENQVWYTTNEGTGYFLKYNVDNDAFLGNILHKRMICNYFPLYILLLEQVYGILHYTEQLEMDLNAEAKEYLEGDDAVVETLNQFQIIIHSFLVKSVYATVSHIENINGYYSYSQKQLRFKEISDNLKSGVEALAGLEKNLMEGKQNEINENSDRALAVLALLAIFSAVLDVTDYVVKMNDPNEMAALRTMPTMLFIIGGYVLIAIIAAPAVFHQMKKKLFK